jgi:hypothetical protein
MTPDPTGATRSRAGGAVTVYPDGSFDWDYAKTEIPFVNYVRDRSSAELCVLISLRSTAAGGLEYTITIVGQRRFAGMNDTLVWCAKPTDATETVRADVVRTLEMGLMRYVARTPMGGRIAIMYRGAVKPLDVEDHWDSWVFRQRFGGSRDARAQDQHTGVLHVQRVQAGPAVEDASARPADQQL